MLSADTHENSPLTIENQDDIEGLRRIGRIVARVLDEMLSAASLDQVHNRLYPAVERARVRSGQLFDLLATAMPVGDTTFRLTDDFATHPVWKMGLTVALEDVTKDLEIMADALRLIRERMESSDRQDDALAQLIGEVRAVSRRLTGAGDGLNETLDPTPNVP